MLKEDAAKPETVAYLWPCNVAAWQHWLDVQTQWRIGMGGATGLCYSGVRAHLSEHGVQGPERLEIWRGITAAERATLAVWAEQRANKL